MFYNLSRTAFPTLKHQFRRLSDCGAFTAKVLKYETYGEPSEVIKLVEEKIEPPKGTEVIVKTLYAPVNPADINTIQGKYPSKPALPAICGNECVGEVVSVGKEVKSLHVGDLIVPNRSNLGTWASFMKKPETDFMKVSSNIDPVALSQITVNPPTAYRMLKDFVCLQSGDTVIQNGANSAVGQAVLQLCKAWGYKSIAVVRDRPEIKELVSFLKCLGATEVLTEEEVTSTDKFKNKELEKPKLALNCVGGKSALNISRHLIEGGVMVTYGGMSRQPITISTTSLIFKDLQYKGFWMTRWSKNNLESPERKVMFDEIMALMSKGDLVAPQHDLVDLKNYKDALNLALSSKGFVGKKMIFKFE